MALALAAESTALTPTPATAATAALIDARQAFGQRSGQQVGPPLEGHPVYGVAFSPAGTQLATAS